MSNSFYLAACKAAPLTVEGLILTVLARVCRPWSQMVAFLGRVILVNAGVHLLRENFKVFSPVEVSVLGLSIEPLCQQLILIPFNQWRNNVTRVYWIILRWIFGLFCFFFNRHVIVRLFVRTINQRTFLSFTNLTFSTWNYWLNILYFWLSLHFLH